MAIVLENNFKSSTFEYAKTADSSTGTRVPLQVLEALNAPQVAEKSKFDGFLKSSEITYKAKTLSAESKEVKKFDCLVKLINHKFKTNAKELEANLPNFRDFLKAVVDRTALNADYKKGIEHLEAQLELIKAAANK